MAIKIIKNTLTDPINRTCDECGSEFEFTYDDIQSGSYMGVFGNTINYRFIICPVCKHRCSFKGIKLMDNKVFETEQCDLSKKDKEDK